MEVNFFENINPLNLNKMKTLITLILNLFKKDEIKIKENPIETMEERILLGLGITFFKPLSSTINSGCASENEKKEAEKMWDKLNARITDKDYTLINFCGGLTLWSRYYNLGDERVQSIKHLFRESIKDFEEFSDLRNKHTVVEKYHIAESIFQKIPIETLKGISEIVKLGAAEFFENKKLVIKDCPDSDDRVSILRVRLAKLVSTQNEFLFVAVGIVLAVMLSDISGNTGLHSNI